MGIIGLRFKSKIQTRYDYQPEMAERVRHQIISHFVQDLKIKARLQNDSVKFKSYLEIMTFNPIIAVFGLTIDSGEIKTINNSGKLQIDYRANSYRGLIIFGLFCVFFGYIGIKVEEIEILSFEALLFLMPIVLYFFLKIFGLRILVGIIEKSLKNRNKTTHNKVLR